MEAEACKHQLASADGGECAESADNGVDNSDSDSEDLGPETAVDVDADDDAENIDAERNHEQAAPTPPADTGWLLKIFKMVVCRPVNLFWCEGSNRHFEF